jgi:dCMP deaminase
MTYIILIKIFFRRSTIIKFIEKKSICKKYMKKQNGSIEFNEYYMPIALAVRERANCQGRKVGAVTVKNNRIIGTGYNGTPSGMKNCSDGGCIRCEKYKDSGELYEKCICVHAEQNAIVTAARFGHGIENSVIYTTLQPCFSCLKESLQAKVITIYYLEKLNITSAKKSKDDKEKDFIEQYNILSNRFEKIPRCVTSLSTFKNLYNIKKYLQAIQK